LTLKVTSELFKKGVLKRRGRIRKKGRGRREKAGKEKRVPHKGFQPVLVQSFSFGGS